MHGQPHIRLTRRVFTRFYQTLRDTGTLPAVRIAAERDVNEGFDEEEGSVQTVQSSPRASTRRTARRLRVPHTSVGTTLHAEGMYPYRRQRVQHLGPGDFAERLEFCKWLNGNRKYIVTACLLTNRNTIATVSIIQTIQHILMWYFSILFWANFVTKTHSCVSDDGNNSCREQYAERGDGSFRINTSNVELKRICHLLALLRGHHIFTLAG